MTERGYRPPPPPWRTRLLIAVAAAVAVLLVGAVIGGWRGITYLNSRCGGGFQGVDGVERSASGECVGVTDGRVIFTDDLRPVEQRIEEENDRVLHSGQQYVSVAYLSPMTLTASDVNTRDSLRHELEGAYAAQYRENHRPGPGNTPLLRVLLANDGSRGAQWAPVVQEIERREKSSDHLVAVAGLGPSLDTARSAIARLSNDGVAMMADIITADDLVAPNLARVSPTNAAEARALVNYVRGRGGYRTALIIQSTDSSDLYAQTLGKGFLQFPDGGHSLVGQQIQQYDPERAASEFRQIEANICVARPDVLLFAGRGRELPALLSALVSRPCPEQPMNVVTGDDASTMPAGADVRAGLASGVTLIYATLAHPAEWTGPSTPAGQATHYSEFTDAYDQYFGTESLGDGQAIMAYDAVLTVSTAVHYVAGLTGSTVTSRAVADEWKLLNQSSSVPGASGEIGFHNDGTPENKAIPLVQLLPSGAVSFLQVSWPCGSPTATCSS